jgi:peptidoglycan-associated lipoprotein
MSQYKVLLLTLALFALAGCTSPTVPDPEMTDATAGSAGADTGSYDDDGLGGGGALTDEDPFAGELSSVIYFDFDSSEVRAMDTDTIARHAVQISGNMRTSVRLEGHADERGSREYNIGLGERRAQAVRRLLLLQGVAAGQLSTVSFGEERPAADASNESAYAQNRRVEIIYTD